jgi:LAO/AO transport system kinase
LATPSSWSDTAAAAGKPRLADDIVDRLAAGDPAALARCISVMESGGAVADRIHRRVCAMVGRAAVIGFTGAPGAGKSTLIDGYIAALRRRGSTVAVAAVDPSSPIFGGAILGDRVRMRRHAEDPGVFIRSVASRGHLGGLSESIHRIVDVMDAAGRSVVIVETVGTGQSEVEVAEIADLCVVVNAPNMGDDVQAMKAGVLEIADVLVVNKADLPSAQRTTDQLSNMLKLRHERRDVPIVETVAIKDTGVETLLQTIDGLLLAHRRDKQQSRQRRMRRLIAQAAGRLMHDQIGSHASGDMARLIEATAAGEIGIVEAAQRALKIIG